ncbi:ATP-binding protein [Thiomonas sp.]
MSAAQQREFRMHPQMLYQVIVAQAGTPAKALLESVMNSIDAGATAVQVTLDAHGYVVEDDGRGFSGEQEVLEFFETFGTPHQEGDARWGKFRMGRGQGFAFATNRWRTGTFEMFVDIKNRGLAYDFRKGLEAVKGCRIEGEWYDQPPAYQLEHWKETLTEFCAWCPVPVILNGTRISQNPAESDAWTLETPEAWLKIDGNTTLKVYNLGVLVRDYHRSYLGVGGIVVSKQGLAMNMARNDILLSQCQVWPRIAATLKEQTNQAVFSGKRQDSDARKYLMSLLIAKEKPVAEMLHWKVFSDVQGRHLTLRQLAENTLPIAVFPKGERAGDMLASRKLALVLQEDTVARFGKGSTDKMLDWLANLCYQELTEISRKLTQQKLLSETEAKNLLGAQGYTPLTENELTPKEIAALRTLADTRFQAYLAQAIGHQLGRRPPRSIRAGFSDVAHAWTDGENFIWIERKLLQQMGTGLDGALRVLAILVHEYLHDQSDANSHFHDFGFYESFELVFTNSNIGDLAGLALNRYLKEAKKRGVPVSRKVVRAAYPEDPDSV